MYIWRCYHGFKKIETLNIYASWIATFSQNQDYFIFHFEKCILRKYEFFKIRHDFCLGSLRNPKYDIKSIVFDCWKCYWSVTKKIKNKYKKFHMYVNEKTCWKNDKWKHILDRIQPDNIFFPSVIISVTIAIHHLIRVVLGVEWRRVDSKYGLCTATLNHVFNYFLKLCPSTLLSRGGLFKKQLGGIQSHLQAAGLSGQAGRLEYLSQLIYNNVGAASQHN